MVGTNLNLISGEMNYQVEKESTYGWQDYQHI